MVALMRRTVDIEKMNRIGASYLQCFNAKNGSLRRLEICSIGYSTHTWGGFILQNYVTYFCEFTRACLCSRQPAIPSSRKNPRLTLG